MEFKTLNNGLKMPMVGLGVYNISERETQKRLTLDGCIVISVGLFGHSGDDDVWMPGVKEMLDDMHLRKIDMADEIFVINVGGYIGESTKREIAYAEQKGKKVNYLEP
jgi:hypothetical protein